MKKVEKEYQFDYENIGLNVYFSSHDFDKIQKAYDKAEKRTGWILSKIETKVEHIGSNTYSGSVSSSGSITLTKDPGETITTYMFVAFKKYNKTTVEQMEKISAKYDNLLDDEELDYEEHKIWKCIIALFLLFLSIALLDGSIRFLISEPKNGSDAMFKMASYFLAPIAAIGIVGFIILWMKNSLLYKNLKWKIKFGRFHKKLENLK